MIICTSVAVQRRCHRSYLPMILVSLTTRVRPLLVSDTGRSRRLRGLIYCITGWSPSSSFSGRPVRNSERSIRCLLATLSGRPARVAISCVPMFSCSCSADSRNTRIIWIGIVADVFDSRTRTLPFLWRGDQSTMVEQSGVGAISTLAQLRFPVLRGGD
jgi:hypothetical protein